MIRKAKIPDIKAIHLLLSDYGNKGELLPRPLSALYDHIRDFNVFEDPETKEVIGCCGLQVCWEDMAEIRSLAVHPDHHGKKIGRMLVQEAINEAMEFGTDKLFTLTYRPGFFKLFDFEIIDRAELPIKIWADCITCVKFPDCDETAMIRYL